MNLDMIHSINHNDALASTSYFIDKNSKLLMRKIPKTEDKTKHRYSEAIIVLKSLVNQLLFSVQAPHFGIRNTYEFLNEKYYWKRIYLDEKIFCKS